MKEKKTKKALMLFAKKWAGQRDLGFVIPFTGTIHQKD